MTEQELIDRLAKIGPTKTQTDRMLNRILNPGKAKPKAFWRRGYRIALPALACLLFAIVAIPAFLQDKEEAAIPLLKPVVAPLAAEFGLPRGTPRAFDAGGVSKFLNYNGSRYTFLNDGAPFDLSALKIEEGEPLGMLDYDISADLQAGGVNGYAKRDFGATYLMGGSLYELPGYEPGFRLAVAHEGSTYIAQLAGKTDGSMIPAGDYVKQAKLGRLAERVELLDQPGKQLLHVWLAKKDLRDWIDRITACEPVSELTNELHDQLALAQSSGKTNVLRWALKDGTSIDMNIFPDMKIVTIGDGAYALPDSWMETNSHLFR
ncbi:hypothetical protein RB620_08140 [Paenibacillus sp. LHD-117]|uniref:hypothetical protein n=1 Tax=Paenibacillus sp. LHD-117 TaxID=3071412 RepID=UPI0027E16417|nr:hypothetical protein [Paenibacillus sp. LHD-117]MDQ6419398.1 hypothetical protein [Paenibacillus sp. LHD-117]